MKTLLNIQATHGARAVQRRRRGTRVRRGRKARTRVCLMWVAPYLETICDEILEDKNALLVLARGLGLHTILQLLVERHHKPSELVFVLNASVEEERQLLLGLAKSGTASTPPAVLNNEVSAQDRVELYLAGGVVLVTSRILVVDLLCDRVPIEQATGIVVCNAHRVSEGSNVPFILRIIRQRNKSAFIKALSDDAHGFTRGFARMEKAMRMLNCKRLQLWPRFHLGVSSVLDKCQPDVEEITVPLTPRGAKLQHALLLAVDDCLKELRSQNASVDVSQLTLENALFKSFDTIVRMQLEPVWHRISRRTRALVHDLQTLRKLLNFLVSYDCVSYFEYLETVFDAASALHPSERPHWILNCSEAVWQLARDRVYELQRTQTFFDAAASTPSAAAELRTDAAAAGEGPKRQRIEGGAASAQASSGSGRGSGSGSGRGSGSGSGSGNGSGDAHEERGAARSLGLSSSVAPVSGARQPPPLSVRPVLEESPKWQALRDLLREIAAKRGRRGQVAGGTADGASAGCQADDGAEADDDSPSSGSGTPAAAAAAAAAAEGEEEAGHGATLIVVQDERTGAMVRELMTHGPRPLLEATFVRWVARRRRGQPQASSTVLSTRQHEARLLRTAADRLAAKHAQQPGAAPRPLQSVDLPEAPQQAGAAGGSGSSSGAGGGSSSAAAGRGGGSRGGASRGRGGGGRSRGQAAPVVAGSVATGGKRSAEGLGASSDVSGRAAAADADAGGGEGGDGAGEAVMGHGWEVTSGLDSASIARHFALLEDPDESTVICTHAATASEVLDELQPRHVILYDPDPAFVRAVELCQAMRPEAGRMQVDRRYETMRR